jgi:hypothetical protein
MPFFRGISLILVPVFRKPLLGFCSVRTAYLHLPGTVNCRRANRESEWWCASRLSHDNFKHGVFLSSAMSPLSRSAMSIVLPLPQLRITLVK